MFQLFVIFLSLSCSLGIQAFENTNLKYFGFYTYNNSDYLHMPYANLYENDKLEVLIEAHDKAGLLGMWYVQDIFYTSSFGLRSDYIESWANASQQVAPLIKNGTVLGFFMGDELINNGVTWDNLDLAVSMVRKSFPDCIIYSNEAFPTFGGTEVYPHVPYGQDWVSIDFYPVWGSYEGLREIYFNYIYPKMDAHQKVMFVSGVFSTTVNPAYYCGNIHCEQVMIAWNLQSFQWASTDDHFVGLFPWHFDTFNTTFLPGFEIGLNELPYLTEAISNIATQITSGKPTPPQPVAQGSICGFSAGTPTSITPCGSSEPESGCPTGFTQQKWIDAPTGDGYLSFCATNNVTESGYSSEGGICGINNGAGADMIPCAGYDPQVACPEGYLQNMWHVAWGSNFLFFCSKVNSSIPDPTGSLCGMVTNGGSTGVFCSGLNPLSSCPKGYAPASWTNVDFGNNQWATCFRI